MKLFYHQNYPMPEPPEEDLTTPSLQDDIKKTRLALEIAEAGFDHAIDVDMIDSYIYQINALQKRYRYLLDQYAQESVVTHSPSHTKTAIRTRISHVFS
ncbi:MAG: YaaL family protein [Lachnospiraceae bacterium]|jgi:hypothetical protein|nr:YaaL family protein [Lachnospiraceae bacterium]